MENLSQRDQKHIWHPLTQHKRNPEVLAIDRAEGVYIYDDNGKAYIDGVSSWYTCVYGHCNPYITQRVQQQMQRLDHVVFAGLTHAPAVNLSEKLMSVLPKNQQKLFFSDNGSTATEVGIKMALQYHYNLGNTKKVVLAMEEGFHGDTFGAMAASNLEVFHGAFQGFLMEVERIPVPAEENLQQLLEYLQNRLRQNDIAGFIYEPLVQGAAAMKMHRAQDLDPVLQLLQKHGVLLIADEVMTGFGKTGTPFASDQIQTKPDIICMSKALTGGLLPMAVTSCTQQVYEAFYSDDMAKGLFHGHTYTANPLACTAALAALELFLTSDIQENIANIVAWHQAFASQIEGHPKVAQVRQTGVILAVELQLETETYGNLRDRLFAHFLELGVYLRPLGNTVYILAPYVITKPQMEQIYQSIESLLENL